VFVPYHSRVVTTRDVVDAHVVICIVASL